MIHVEYYKDEQVVKTLELDESPNITPITMKRIVVTAPEGYDYMIVNGTKINAGLRLENVELPEEPVEITTEIE